MTWQSIVETYDSSQMEFKKLHSTYECTLADVDQTIRIDVWEYPDGTFVGLADHSIKSPEQISPYRSHASQKTPEQALSDAVNGIMTYYKSPYDEIEFAKV